MKKKVCKEYILEFHTGMSSKSLDLWWDWEWNMNTIWLLAMWSIGNRSQNLPLLQAYLRWVEKPRQVQMVKPRLGLVPTWSISLILLSACLSRQLPKFISRAITELIEICNMSQLKTNLIYAFFFIHIVKMLFFFPSLTLIFLKVQPIWTFSKISG